jgi:thioester reductase-like protein
MIDIPAVDRQHLLLTGATGLLGSYLVRDLLLDGQPLAVVVRRSRRESPEARIERIVSDWETELGKRLPRPRVLAGDLTAPCCGLSDADLGWVARHCSALLHNAASLSFRGSDRAAEPWLSNVTGTANMLDLVRVTDIEHLHHVSTAYVCGLRSGTVAEDDLDVGQDFGNDYERSKVEAETMIRAAAGPASVTVYRPSIIVGDSHTGFTSTYHGLFAVLRLGHTLLTKVALGSTSCSAILRLLGVAPSNSKNFVPVDWVSAVIAHGVQKPEARGRTFHVTHPEPVSNVAFGAVVQEAVERYSKAASPDDPELCDEQWFADNLSAQLDVYRSYFRNDPTFDRANTEAIAGHIPCPPLDHPRLMRMAKFAIDQDFGRAPRPARRTAEPVAGNLGTPVG